MTRKFYIPSLLALLLLALSPSILSAQSQVKATLQSNAVANGNGTSLNTNLMATATITVNCVSCSGGTTINFEGSEDGTGYVALSATNLAASSTTTTTTTSGTTVWVVSVTGLQFIRTRISTYSAGTITITATAVALGGGGGAGGGGGGAISGTVAISQDTPGTTNAVVATIPAAGVAAGAFPNASITVLGNTTDNRCTTTDTTACALDGLTKQINFWLSSIAGGTATSSVTDTCDGLVPSKKYYISVGSTEDESEVKATAGTLCGIWARNAHASTNAFIKCTNLTAANTTPGSSAVFFEMMVPFGLEAARIPHIPFSVALTCYIVTGKAASDATEVGADDVSYVLTYQ